MLSKQEEENIHGFTGDMKYCLRENDFESALILLNDLKRYIIKIKNNRL